MQHDPAPVADDLGHRATEHADDKEPGSPLQANSDVYDHGYCEKDQEADVSGQGRLVLIDTQLGWTQGQGAIGLWTVDDIVAVSSLVDTHGWLWEW